MGTLPALIGWFVASASAAPLLTVATDAGPVNVVLAYHGTLQLELGGRTLWVDPWSKAPLKDATKGTVVLITDIHPDHLDPAALALVKADGARVVAPKAVSDSLGDGQVSDVLNNGQSVELDGLQIESVPMYNNTRGPKEGKLFHDKGRGNGYVLTWGGKRLYIAGDTACTADMKALKNIDHALIPMNLPYTMPPDEAADCVKAFQPKKVTPYHYAGSDLGVFQAGLTGVAGVEVVLIDAYPGGLPW